MRRTVLRAIVLWLAASGAAVPAIVSAQAVPAAERDALVRLRVERGGNAQDLEPLIRQADDAGAKGLPVAPLTNKIREGLAKGYPPSRIEPVVRQMAVQLEQARDLLQELAPAAGGPPPAPAVTLLAESLAGLTPEEIRTLGRQIGESGRPALSPDLLAAGAKGLSFIDDARLPVADGVGVIAESIRQGYRPHEILDLGREIKRREDEFQTGRADLRALRASIAGGSRPEQLFRDRPGDRADRAPSGRDTRVDRPERPAPPERIERPERPAPPERPTGPAR